PPGSPRPPQPSPATGASADRRRPAARSGLAAGFRCRGETPPRRARRSRQRLAIARRGRRSSDGLGEALNPILADRAQIAAAGGEAAAVEEFEDQDGELAASADAVAEGGGGHRAAVAAPRHHRRHFLPPPPAP